MLSPPNERDPWPPIPTVLRDFGNFDWTLRRSYVLLLLSRTCAGMHSNATFDEVVARVRDHGALADMFACMNVDEKGCDEGEYESLGREVDVLNPTSSIILQLEYGLAPLKQKISESDCDGLSRLAYTAAEEQDNESYQRVMMALTSKICSSTQGVNLFGVVFEIGEMAHCGNRNCPTLARWLGPLWCVLKTDLCENGNITSRTVAWSGHTRHTFEILLGYALFNGDEKGEVVDAMVLLNLYEPWSLSALCKLWREQKHNLLQENMHGHPLCNSDDSDSGSDSDDSDYDYKEHLQWRESMRRLLRCTILELRRPGLKWQRVGVLLDVVQSCFVVASQPPQPAPLLAPLSGRPSHGASHPLLNPLVRATKPRRWRHFHATMRTSRSRSV